MKYAKLETADMAALIELHLKYKAEIGEETPTDAEIKRLVQAIGDGRICFYGAFCNDGLIGTCSVCVTFSTFNYSAAGVFEDFYILPEYQHRGIARELANFAYRESGVQSMTVGCADCDVEMYRALGFDIPLGNLLSKAE